MREIPEPGHCGVEQGAQDPWSSFREFAPELRFVLPGLGLYAQKLDYQRTVKKIGPRSTEVGYRVENQRTGGIENGLVVVAVQFPATEAAAGRQATGGICQLFW